MQGPGVPRPCWSAMISSSCSATERTRPCVANGSAGACVRMVTRAGSGKKHYVSMLADRGGDDLRDRPDPLQRFLGGKREPLLDVNLDQIGHREHGGTGRAVCS